MVSCMRHASTILRWLVGWVWTPLLARGALWLGAFLALAHVGSGAAVRSLAPRVAAVTAGVAKAAPRASVAAAARSAGPSPRAAPCPSQSDAKEGGAPLDLNQATVEQLDALPGIGAKRAAAILALRERLGGFRRLQDLARVRGIGYRSLQRLAPLVMVGPRRRTPADAGVR